MDPINKKILEKMRKQSIKALMDVFLLSEIRNGAMSGYDAMSFIRNKYGVLISAGTVYSHLYAMEREGLVSGTDDSKTRIFEITEKGEEMLEMAVKATMDLLSSFKESVNQ